MSTILISAETLGARKAVLLKELEEIKRQEEALAVGVDKMAGDIVLIKGMSDRTISTTLPYLRNFLNRGGGSKLFAVIGVVPPVIAKMQKLTREQKPCSCGGNNPARSRCNGYGYC